MATLIQKVAEGSKNKHKYQDTDNYDKMNFSNHMATELITQITSKSALEQAFECLGKHQRIQVSDANNRSSDFSATDGSDLDSNSGYESSDDESDSTKSSLSLDSSSHS